MNLQRSIALLALVMLPLIAGAPVLAQRSPQANAAGETEGAIDGWARENYGRALDLVLRDRCAPTDALWRACISILPGHQDEIEYSLSVERRYGGTILAHITRPKTQSVYTGLYEGKKGHPLASVNELTKLIQVESQAGDQRRFPRLVHLADEFEKIQFSPTLPNELMMDATKYLFHVRSYWGDRMDLILSGPGSAAPHQPQPLIQWAESAREMLARAFN